MRKLAVQFPFADDLLRPFDTLARIDDLDSGVVLVLQDLGLQLCFTLIYDIIGRNGSVVGGFSFIPFDLDPFLNCFLILVLFLN